MAGCGLCCGGSALPVDDFVVPKRSAAEVLVAEAVKRGNPTRSGTLLKLSRRGAWQSRHFVLRPGLLTYYESAESIAVLGAVPLSTVVRVTTDNINDGEFQLVLPDGRALALRSNEGPIDAATWADAIERSMTRAPVAGVDASRPHHLPLLGPGVVPSAWVGRKDSGPGVTSDAGVGMATGGGATAGAGAVASEAAGHPGPPPVIRPPRQSRFASAAAEYDAACKVTPPKFTRLCVAQRKGPRIPVAKRSAVRDPSPSAAGGDEDDGTGPEGWQPCTIGLTADGSFGVMSAPVETVDGRTGARTPSPAPTALQPVLLKPVTQYSTVIVGHGGDATVMRLLDTVGQELLLRFSTPADARTWGARLLTAQLAGEAGGSDVDGDTGSHAAAPLRTGVTVAGMAQAATSILLSTARPRPSPAPTDKPPAPSHTAGGGGDGAPEVKDMDSDEDDPDMSQVPAWARRFVAERTRQDHDVVWLARCRDEAKSWFDPPPVEGDEGGGMGGSGPGQRPWVEMVTTFQRGVERGMKEVSLRVKDCSRLRMVGLATILRSTFEVVVVEAANAFVIGARTPADALSLELQMRLVTALEQYSTWRKGMDAGGRGLGSPGDGAFTVIADLHSKLIDDYVSRVATKMTEYGTTALRTRQNEMMSITWVAKPGVSTSSLPTDLLSFVGTFLGFSDRCASTRLQGYMVSACLAIIVRVAQEMLYFVLERKREIAVAGAGIPSLCVCVNDVALLMDGVESIVGPRMSELDAAQTLDVDRTIASLKSTGWGMAAAVAEECARPSMDAVDAMFTEAWTTGAMRRQWADVSYIEPLHHQLEVYFAPITCEWVAALIVAKYFVALLGPEVLPKLAGGRARPRLGGSNVLDDAKLRVVAADEAVLMTQVLSRLLPPTSLRKFQAALRCFTDMLTDDAGHMLSALHRAIDMQPTMSPECFFLWDRCISVRRDLGATASLVMQGRIVLKDAMDQAEAVMGTVDAGDDDRPSLEASLLPGMVTGSGITVDSIAVGGKEHWDASNLAASVLHIIFPPPLVAAKLKALSPIDRAVADGTDARVCTGAGGGRGLFAWFNRGGRAAVAGTPTTPPTTTTPASPPSSRPGHRSSPTPIVMDMTAFMKRHSVT